MARIFRSPWCTTRVESEFRDRCDRYADARASIPAGRRRARGGRIALRLRARRRRGPRRLLHADRHPVFKSLQSRHSAGRARFGHRGYLDPSAFRRTAIPRGKPAAHRGDDETAAAEDFLAGGRGGSPNWCRTRWRTIGMSTNPWTRSTRNAPRSGANWTRPPPRKARDRPCMASRGRA